MYLRVPPGAQARTVQVRAVNGALVAAFSPRWNEGLHALPEFDLSPGVYQLRVNAHDNFRFIRP